MSQETLIQHYQLKLKILQFLSYPPHLYRIARSKSNPNNIHMFFYGTAKKEDIECAVLIEFDENRPAYGIYYGCKVPSSKFTAPAIDKQWETIIKTMKNDFGMHWNNFNKANNRILSCEHEDKKHYWPFWIRLNDDEDIYEAVKGVQIIIQSLLYQGFSFSRVEKEEDVAKYIT